MLTQKKEGKPLRETEDMKIWKEEFKEMSLEDHNRVLKSLGLDEGDIADFNEIVKSNKSAEELLGLDGSAEEESPKTNKTKKK